MNSPIVTIFFKLVGVVLFLNRVLYSMAVYKRMKIERDEDIYLKNNFCNQVSHREIGRHTTLCLEAERRLASPVIFHTVQEVVNDTLYRELQFRTIAQVTGVILVVMLLGAFHNKYVKNNSTLPISNKQLKID